MSSQTTSSVRALIVLLLALSAFASDPPRMVVDLPGGYVNSSMPLDTISAPFWATVDGTTWFVASRADKNQQIWRTDGTTEGTVQVTDIYTAGGHAEGPFLGIVNGKLIYAGNKLGRQLFALSVDGGEPVSLAWIVKAKWNHTIVVGPILDGYLYFASFFNYQTGFELWRTDGTTAGTKCLDLSPGKGDGLTRGPLVEFDDSLWFSADLPAGNGLYRSDGTSAGTRYVRPGSPVGVAGNRLILTEKNASGRSLLWATDGTHEELLFDYLSGPYQGRTVDSQLYFNANDGIHGIELWTTDGTREGTVFLTDLIPEADRGPLFSERAGSRLFYIAETPKQPCEATLFAVSDGERSRGVCLDDLGAGYTSGFALGDRYCFGVSDDPDPRVAQSLWCSDGSLASRMAPIGVGWGTYIFGAGLTLASGSALFTGSDSHGWEPWVTDGTPAGTKLLKNIAAETSMRGSDPRLLRAALNRVFFAAKALSAIGISDGSASGTSTTALSFAVHEAVVSGDRLFFSAGHFQPTVLGVSDGTAAGTRLLDPYAPLYRYAPVSDGLIFSDRRESAGYYFTDGTLAGTRRLAEGSGDVVAAGGFAWFRTLEGMLRSDGRPEGTRRLEGGDQFSSPVSAATLGDAIYILDGEMVLARTSATGNEITPVKKLGERWGGPTGAMRASSRYLYIVVRDGLWRSDGTEAGTIRLAQIEGLADCPSSTTLVGDTMFWLATTREATSLWKSEGTTETTFPIATVPPVDAFPSFGECPSLASADGTVYFAAESQFEGLELWSSDGTVQGARLLEDIWPGIHSSAPAGFTAVGNQVFFSAATPTAQRELWVIDARTGKRRRGVRH